MDDEIEVNGKRSQTVKISAIASSHSRSIRIQFVCLIFFIILFLITLSALIAIIFIFGLQNRECIYLFFFLRVCLPSQLLLKIFFFVFF